MKKLVKFTILFMFAIVVFIPAGIASAVGTEIIYDDGEVDTTAKAALGGIYIVRFTPPSAPVTLAQVQVYCTGGQSSPQIPPGYGFIVHVFNEYKKLVYSQYYEVSQGWNNIDLSTESIPTIESDFYVGFEFVDSYYPCIGVDIDSNYNRSYLAWSPYGAFTLKSPDTNYMIRTIVESEMIKVASVTGVNIDIKPGSYINPLNIREKGVIPVTILGTEDFEITQIDPSTLILEGVSPLRWSYEDVYEEDGYMDLSLKFKAQELVAALGSVNDGDEVVLTLNGTLKEEFGGAAISGEDVVVIIAK